MNKQREQQEKLLADALHGNWADGPAAVFAKNAAAVARRRQRVRRALVATGTAAGVAAIFVFSALHRSPPATLAPTAAKTTPPAYEIISDDELIAQVHDRPLLILTGENGGKKIVLLEH